MEEFVQVAQGDVVGCGDRGRGEVGVGQPPSDEGVTYIGKSGKRYIFGNNTVNRYNDVDPQDVELFLGMEGFRAIRRPEPVKQQEEKAPPPKVIESQSVIETHQEPEPVQEVAAAPKPKRTRKAKA